MLFVQLTYFLFGIVLPFRRKAQHNSDEAKVNALYQEYGYILRRRCFRILRNEALVEDAMQEILLTLYRRHHQYQGDPQKILSWLYRVTTTHCLQLLDKEKRWFRNLHEHVERQQLEQDDPSPAMTVEEKLTLEQVLEDLSPEQQEAVVYRYVSGMTQEEIAHLMGVSRDRVRRWLKLFQQRGRVLLEGDFV